MAYLAKADNIRVAVDGSGAHPAMLIVPQDDLTEPVILQVQLNSVWHTIEIPQENLRAVLRDTATPEGDSGDD
jgi:hypothetical protein